jgi:hypothetical protein
MELVAETINIAKARVGFTAPGKWRYAVPGRSPDGQNCLVQ